MRLTNPDLYALDLLAAVLGQGESSILTQEIRDKQQLVSGISCSDNTPSYVDGSFSVTMRLDPAKIKPATEAVLAIVERLKTAPLESDRIARAKSLVRMHHIESIQTSDEIASDLATSFMFTGEFEVPEFDLANTFSYAEMAALIAPRPFMVERGHADGVGLDEYVAFEYAKVRRLYAKLGLPGWTAIEFFLGGHMINGQGTFAFLEKHLKWPK